MKYSLKSFPLHIALFVILSCILAGISVSNALILKLIMDFSTNKTERMSYLLLVLVVIGYILINAVFYYFQQYNSDYLAKKSVFLYRNIIFKRIVQSSLSHYTKKDLGEYISLMTSQMDKFRTKLFRLYLLGKLFTYSVRYCLYSSLFYESFYGIDCYYFEYSECFYSHCI